MNAVSLTLRDRLRVLQAAALRQLAAADRIDSGLMSLVADTGAVLAAIDAGDDAGVAPAPEGRAVVLDDNMQIKVVVFSADKQAAAATLSPAAAIRLAGQLISSACRRL